MWKDILKSYNESMILDAFVELQKAVNIWAGINNHPMGDKDDFGSLEHRLFTIKQIAFYDKEEDIYKQFSKIEDITDGDNSVNRPLWNLYKMLEWREDNA